METMTLTRRPDIALAGYEGWIPALGTMSHYFRAGRSLCHMWRSDAPWEEMAPDDGFTHPSQCEVCRKVLDSELATELVA